MPAKKSYYDVLGVGRNATADEIKKAFRRKAAKLHPDAGGDEEEFKQLNEAYEVLKDPEKKKEYDTYGQYMGGAAGQSYQGNPFGQGGNPFGQGNNPFGQGSNPFAGYTTETRYSDSIPSGWSQIFDSIRNGEGAFGSSWDVPETARKGADITAELEVSFDDAFNGTTKTVTVRVPSTGEKQTIKVKVPQGAVDGGKLRYHGKGEYGTGKGERGDLVLITKIRPDALYSRKGADVVMNLPVSLSEAALGCEVKVPAPDGTTVKVKVPAGTQSGKRLRVRDKGAKKVKGSGYGSLVIVIEIVVPTDLNAAQRSALEQFQAAQTASVRPGIEERLSHARSRAVAYG